MAAVAISRRRKSHHFRQIYGKRGAPSPADDTRRDPVTRRLAVTICFCCHFDPGMTSARSPWPERVRRGRTHRTVRNPAAQRLIEGEKQEAIMKKLVALVLALMVTGLAGCNTMHGLGKDIERGGEKLQGTSKNTQERM